MCGPLHSQHHLFLNGKKGHNGERKAIGNKWRQKKAWHLNHSRQIRSTDQNERDVGDLSYTQHIKDNVKITKVPVLWLWTKRHLVTNFHSTIRVSLKVWRSGHPSNWVKSRFLQFLASDGLGGRIGGHLFPLNWGCWATIDFRRDLTPQIAHISWWPRRPWRPTSYGLCHPHPWGKATCQFSTS